MRKREVVSRWGCTFALYGFMPRARVIYSSDSPYHITARSNNRDWFDVPMDYCYGVYINILSECIGRFGIRVHSFVLMNNHFHMIISTPRSNIAEVLRYFMTETSRGIRLRSQRINHIYGGRNHKSLIIGPAYYAHCYKYVIRNPVGAGICSKVEDYKWSSISKFPSEMKALIVPPSISLLEYVPSNLYECLSWLNTPLQKELLRQCQVAAKRQRFEFKPSREGQKLPNLIEALHTQKVPGT